MPSGALCIGGSTLVLETFNFETWGGSTLAVVLLRIAFRDQEVQTLRRKARMETGEAMEAKASKKIVKVKSQGV